jgi:hypothetical protein
MLIPLLYNGRNYLIKLIKKQKYLVELDSLVNLTNKSKSSGQIKINRCALFDYSLVLLFVYEMFIQFSAYNERVLPLSKISHNYLNT